MERLTILFALILAVLLAAGCSEKSNSVEDLTAAKADFERACSACHSLDVALGLTKSAEGWQETVKRMVAKGAALDHRTEDGVARYLFSIRGKK